MRKIYHVDYDKCAYNRCGRPCISYCPVTITNKKLKGKKKTYPAIDFKKSTQQIIIHSEYCIQCGICITKCPYNAIYVKNLVEEPDDKEFKIHEYEGSGFSLYNLPTLKRGRVCGLCGPNGIGKSTILNILSTKLVPNFGDVGKEKNKTAIAGKNEEYDKERGSDGSQKRIWRDVAKRIKDNDIKKHFLEIAEGVRKISYKPQVLKILFEQYKGKRVKDIINEAIGWITGEYSDIDENTKKNALEYYRALYDALDLGVIKDRYLEECSGGELQRFAIALVLLSDADVYLIDEPVTFLDVKKRIQLAEYLSKRARGFNSNKNNEEKAILVVDHDLAVLDYMSDVIHLFYGEPHKFGVITKVMPVKSGINSYLKGYLKTENIQFREKEIKFRKTISGRTWSNARVFAEWNEIKKTLGGFSLDISPGLIYQNEILGVVGENGLGKTTFFKILIGLLKPDEGNINLSEKFALSYKPQYISNNYNGTVEELISEYSSKYIHTQELIEKLYIPLGIEDLMEKEVKSLSGGQLQRTFIGACLTKDANLYLIDEPSAYLDVEERLKISEIIRSHVKSTNASAICIEHDIQIVDALADRLLIFLGTPGKKGITKGPLNKRDGMNIFLKALDITFRRDDETGRARINKKGSNLDKMQRIKNQYYYT
ncbi:MAG: ribosome biogenesis/translation initiation ATPase RLI [Promethearchaeota archaeon]